MSTAESTMIQTINPSIIRANHLPQSDNDELLMQKRMKMNNSTVNNHRPTQYFAESQTHPVDYNSPNNTTNGTTFRAPVDRIPSTTSERSGSGNSDVPPGLAPTGMMRQHSSGTARFLESSLFDEPGNPSMDQMPINPPTFYNQNSFDSASDDRRRIEQQQFVYPSGYQSSSPRDQPVNPVQATNSNQSLRSNPSPQSATRSAALPQLLPDGSYGFVNYPTSSPNSDFIMQQSPRSAHSFFNNSPDWQPPPNQRNDSFITGPTRQSSSLEENQSPLDFTSSPAGLNAMLAKTASFNNIPRGSLIRFLSGQNLAPEGMSDVATPQLTPSRLTTEESQPKYSVVGPSGSPGVPQRQHPQTLSVASNNAQSSAPSSPASYSSNGSSRPGSPVVRSRERRASTRDMETLEPRKKKVKRESDHDDKDSVGSVHSHGSNKDRHVNSAVKLRTNDDDDTGEPLMQTRVRQIFYEKPDAKPHRIRLIEVVDVKTRARSMYAHGADVGSVVERKSNISRLFGKFTSPDEKLLMNVPGSHNHTVGQESNILTEAGIERFLGTNKMRGQDHYRNWINSHLIPLIRAANSGLAYDADDAEHPILREHDSYHLAPGSANETSSIPSSPGSVNSSNHSQGSYSH